MPETSAHYGRDRLRSTNMARVPLRSPFRYPGGKTWLVPLIRRWLTTKQRRPREFIEPFAGGGIVGLSVAFEELAGHVTLMELDREVAAVWQAILGRQARALANRLVEFALTRSSAEQVLAHRAISQIDRAFHTILKNRINHGGVLAPRAGRLRLGDGNGIGSRWYPETLKRRILDIHAIRERLSFIWGDGLQLIKDYSDRKTCTFFIDPPYTAGGKSAGARLYLHSEIDHPLLFCLASRVQGDFIMTYEDTEEVRALAQQHGFDILPIDMKNKYHAKMTELLIGRDLDWARQNL